MHQGEIDLVAFDVSDASISLAWTDVDSQDANLLQHYVVEYFHSADPRINRVCFLNPVQDQQSDYYRIALDQSTEGTTII
jgi:hypothetical protein